MYSVIIVGTEGSGKTALCDRYIAKIYKDKYQPTIEDTYIIQKEVDNRALTVELMDTSGQLDDDSIIKMLPTVSCILFTIIGAAGDDVRFLERKLRKIREIEDYIKLPILIIRTKIDKYTWFVDEEQEDLDRIKNIYNVVDIIQTSALTGEGIDTCFSEAFKLCLIYEKNKKELKEKREKRDEGESRRNSVQMQRSTSILNLFGSRRNSIKIDLNGENESISSKISPKSSPKIGEVDSNSGDSGENKEKENIQQTKSGSRIKLRRSISEYPVFASSSQKSGGSTSDNPTGELLASNNTVQSPTTLPSYFIDVSMLSDPWASPRPITENKYGKTGCCIS